VNAVAERITVHAAIHGSYDALLPALKVTDDHMRVYCDATSNRAWRESADVLCHDRPVTVAGLESCLAAHPGCAICVGVAETGTILLVGRIRGQRFAMTGTAGAPGVRHLGGADGAWAASVLHALLSNGCSVDSIRGLRGPDNLRIALSTLNQVAGRSGPDHVSSLPGFAGS
jgi:hypothetical protein